MRAEDAPAPAAAAATKEAAPKKKKAPPKPLPEMMLEDIVPGLEKVRQRARGGRGGPPRSAVRRRRAVGLMLTEPEQSGHRVARRDVPASAPDATPGDSREGEGGTWRVGLRTQHQSQL